MSWLDGVRSIFRRADIAAATASLHSSIASGIAPNLDTVSEETGVHRRAMYDLLRDSLATEVHDRVSQGISGGHVPTEDICHFATSMGLVPEDARHLVDVAVSEHLTNLLAEVLADNMVDPQEDQRIARFLAVSGISTINPDTAKLIDDGRELYRACSAPLNPVQAPVLLKKGEFCVHAVAAEALEERSRTVRVGYHGPSARVRIARGIYYNVGSMAVSRQTQDYQFSFGVGVLCVTNRRLLWISEQKSISTMLANIVRYDPYSDGLRIMKGTGKPLLFLWHDKPRIATIMATRAIEELRV